MIERKFWWFFFRLAGLRPSLSPKGDLCQNFLLFVKNQNMLPFGKMWKAKLIWYLRGWTNELDLRTKSKKWRKTEGDRVLCLVIVFSLFSFSLSLLLEFWFLQIFLSILCYLTKRARMLAHIFQDPYSAKFQIPISFYFARLAKSSFESKLRDEA